jgi:hypothetical protein
MTEMNNAAEPTDVSREKRREDSIVGVHGGDVSSSHVAQPVENWRSTAKLIAGETDTAKLMELTDQLIRELDRTQVGESRLATATSDSPSIASGRQHDEGFALRDKSEPNRPE